MINNVNTKHYHIPDNVYTQSNTEINKNLHPINTKYINQNNKVKYNNYHVTNAIEANHLRDIIRKLLREPAVILKNGGLVAFPTETVYGLGASIYNEQAVNRIFQVKGRPQDNPLIAHIGYFDQLFELATFDSSISEKIKKLMPGPISFVLKAIPCKIPASVRAGLQTIAIRMPDNVIAQELINLCGFPIVAPSANISSKPSCTSFEEVVHDFDGKIEGIIDGGNTIHGIESTIVSLVGKPVILRPGIITKEDLLPLFPDIDYYDNSEVTNSNKPLFPGMKYKHYTPNAIVLIVSQNNIAGANKEVFVSIQKIIKKYIKNKNMSFSCLFNSDLCYNLFNEAFQMIQSSTASYIMKKYSSIYDFAKEMYSQFRFADNNNIDIILVEEWPSHNFGFTVMNRLNKAATDFL